MARLDHERRSNMTRQGCRYAAIALAALAVGCVPGSVAAPDDAPGVTLSVVTGSAQSGRAGEELPWPLVVLATSAAGRPLAGYTVVYVVTQGGGSLFTSGVLTNSLGLAQNYWTLGQAGLQAVEVRSVDPSTGRKQLHGTFTATITP
jgi:hypothetical protein